MDKETNQLCDIKKRKQRHRKKKNKSKTEDSPGISGELYTVEIDGNRETLPVKNNFAIMRSPVQVSSPNLTTEVINSRPKNEHMQRSQNEMSCEENRNTEIKPTGQIESITISKKNEIAIQNIHPDLHSTIDEGSTMAAAESHQRIRDDEVDFQKNCFDTANAQAGWDISDEIATTVNLKLLSPIENKAGCTLLRRDSGILATDMTLQEKVVTVVSEDMAKVKKNKEERRAEFLKLKSRNETANLKPDINKSAISGEVQKSKAELRAERRALQETQRAAKAACKDKAGPVKSQPTAVVKPRSSSSLSDKVKPSSTAVVDQKVLLPDAVKQNSSLKKVQFFSHLQQFKRNDHVTAETLFSAKNIHASILRLGLQYAESVVVGSNARSIALLHAFKQVILAYTTPPNKELARDLEETINTCINYLQGCRPFSVSMENAVKFLKWNVTSIPNNCSDIMAKKELNEAIDLYIKENINLADEAIAKFALTKIDHGDNILIFGHSSVINTVLITAHKKGKEFHVVVVDSRPKMEGRKTIVTLVKQGVKCSYILISALSYTMQKVTKVFLGAHALLANGYVMGRVGSSQVALVAKAFNVPVLVCCETHKFSERVQTDSFVYNELGNPEELQDTLNHENLSQDQRTMTILNFLNLAYDVTPPELVSVVVTELGMLPCTSVPVVLRVKHTKV